MDTRGEKRSLKTRFLAAARTSKKRISGRVAHIFSGPTSETSFDMDTSHTISWMPDVDPQVGQKDSVGFPANEDTLTKPPARKTQRESITTEKLSASFQSVDQSNSSTIFSLDRSATISWMSEQELSFNSSHPTPPTRRRNSTSRNKASKLSQFSPHSTRRQDKNFQSALSRKSHLALPHTVRIKLPRSKNGFGFSLKGSSPATVSRVKPHSAAHRSGLMVGDELIKVCGTSVNSHSAVQIHPIIHSHQGTIKLEVRRFEL